MGAIEDVYADLETDVSEEEFREAVLEKVEQMDGLADEETAAMLIAHELSEDEINGIADIDAGMEEVKFLAKVVSVGDIRTFERDDGEGQVLNLEVADETGRVRVALWDQDAAAAEEELHAGDVLRIKGRPKEGYSGLEVSASRVEGDQDADIDVDLAEEGTIESLSLGQSDVSVRGKVLGVEPVRTFDRNDGSEGRVSNLVLGDETGRVRVTMWDEQADTVEALSEGISVEIVDGYVRDRDGTLELHVGERGAIKETNDEVSYVPETTNVADLELGDTVDIAGVIRSADPKRTFDRDDGSEGQVRNVRVQDKTGDIRVAMWGEKADVDIGPGDEVLFADVEVKDGWQDDLEASAGWRSTVSVLDAGATDAGDATDGATTNGTGSSASDQQSTGLSAFASDTSDAAEDAETGATAEASETPATEADATDGPTEFTGTVVQTGDPVMLDDGSETLTVETDADVRLGQEVTVRGRLVDGRLDADEVF
ncbi:single-stranded DNA binding protein [Halomarina oriensis]|uniref:Single-stranded DNA binding protein n=1 Tax=Halomarina oriensis TaxID=671145 RepID=A0A6B0GG32_9EURY|nr:single-stranded DNA binding protein [Halomarina oriensis]MWG32987.1 single-stranded DNA binding protein [Halomarina oriensis]